MASVDPLNPLHVLLCEVSVASVDPLNPLHVLLCEVSVANVDPLNPLHVLLCEVSVGQRRFPCGPAKSSLHVLTADFIVQELCESRGGRPGLSVLTSLLVSVDVKNY